MKGMKMETTVSAAAVGVRREAVLGRVNGCSSRGKNWQLFES
jgi:hypothetical protein